MQGVDVVHGAQRRVPRMAHDSKYVEVVAETTGGQQQTARRVERHSADWLVGVRRKMRDQAFAIGVRTDIHLKNDKQTVWRRGGNPCQ